MTRPRRLPFLRVLRWAAVAGAAGWLAFRLAYPPLFEWYTGVTNPPLTYENAVTLSPGQFEAVVDDLSREARTRKADAVSAREKSPFTRRLMAAAMAGTRSVRLHAEFPHVKYFRDAGMLRYDGPVTCLRCHAGMNVRHPDGTVTRVDTLDDVVNTVHFAFQSTAAGFTTFGYDGRQVNTTGRAIPVGKIDRACGIPGSFSWTGWAALVTSHPAGRKAPVTRSEGCGQCHIGGNTHPASERMLPVGDVPRRTKLQGVDCLICHAAVYDMNERFVVDAVGGRRWNQDRSLKAALTVGRPTAATCLRCHQHNLGGDTYTHNAAAKDLGYRNARILHGGAKRGTGFSPEDDVHAAAGMDCTDCHVPQGHRIPRGRLGTDLVATDLPGTAVDCATCHTAAPHTRNPKWRVILNGHTDRLSCEACHVTKLENASVVLRDWIHPTWNAAEGVWEPTDLLRTSELGVGMDFLWFNGNGTFLANALGDNPTGDGSYNPLLDRITRMDGARTRALLRPAVERLAARYHFDVDAYLKAATDTLSQLPPELLAQRRRVVEERLRPLMRQGKSRLYPFKLFNAMMLEDMSNQGPFGAMILPFDYATYYETGKPDQAVVAALGNRMVRRMYQPPFKLYMMDEFMHYFGVATWSGAFPLRDGKLVHVEPHWMRQMGTLMVNHAIKPKGRSCTECHAPGGIMDFRRLGYPPERVRELQKPPELDAFNLSGR